LVKDPYPQVKVLQQVKKNVRKQSLDLGTDSTDLDEKICNHYNKAKRPRLGIQL